MSKEIAKEKYLGKNGDRMNCAQSIIGAFRYKFDEKKDLVDLFKRYGNGRAPNGFCGAYYAALYILEKKHPEKSKEFKDFFIVQLGFETCRELKENKISCIKCVEISAEFLEKIK
jgi:hypothetical protein